MQVYVMGNVLGRAKQVERAAEEVVKVAEDVVGVAKDVAEIAVAVEDANPVAVVQGVEGLVRDGEALIDDIGCKGQMP